jgi:hypothetical protein
MARAFGNLIGNCVAAVVIGAWEGDLDRVKVARVLGGRELVDISAEFHIAGALDRRSARDPGQQCIARHRRARWQNH